MNSDKLNYIIKKKSNGNNNIAHHLHQMFFFECVLRRIEVSKYKNNIILKGGVLLSSIIGEDLRTTKDKDFYDIYMLLNSDANIKDINLLLAIKNTFNKRNTLFDIREFKEIIEIIKESDKLRKVYNDYQLKLEYTHNVSFEDTVDALEKIVNILERMNVSV